MYIQEVANMTIGYEKERLLKLELDTKRVRFFSNPNEASEAEDSIIKGKREHKFKETLMDKKTELNLSSLAKIESELYQLAIPEGGESRDYIESQLALSRLLQKEISDQVFNTLINQNLLSTAKIKATNQPVEVYLDLAEHKIILLEENRYE